MEPFLPHSMLRIEVMGLDDSVNRDPTKAEIDRMAGILEEAMQAGYLGMSTEGLPLHFLANQPNLKKRIPTQYASYAEYKTLTDVVRRHDRVWQMTPATDDGGLTVKLFMLSSGRLHGKPLKITALAALDSAEAPLRPLDGARGPPSGRIAILTRPSTIQTRPGAASGSSHRRRSSARARGSA